MADLLEKLWPAFVSEVTEQLDSVELLLAKSGAAKSVDVNDLFRNFHTIKGNCSMIGFTSMETVAHRSEDILSAVRNNEMAMETRGKCLQIRKRPALGIPSRSDKYCQNNLTKKLYTLRNI